MSTALARLRRSVELPVPPDIKATNCGGVNNRIIEGFFHETIKQV